MPALLLYGATGYSGRLIAELAQQRWADGKQGLRLILAGRNGQLLSDLARRLKVGYRVFGLDDRHAVEAGLQDVFALINAAGPFALTAEPLAKAALRCGCHYVDINGEVDVYKRLDDLGYLARQRRLAMVCGAGHSAVASELLLEEALRYLKGTTELGAVRIALSQIDQPSRGSIQTVLRTLREQVLVVRDGGERKGLQSSKNDRFTLTYVPLGQLERVFDFGLEPDATSADPGGPARRRRSGPRPARRIASAVNLIDTLTARLTAARHVDRVLRIESYLECSDFLRAIHQWSAITAPLWWISTLRDIATRQIELLPEGPTAGERTRERLSVVLEIEDIWGHPLIDWRLETPSAYDFTACAAVTVAERMAQPVPGYSTRAEGLAGWRTPAELLVDQQGACDPCTGAQLRGRSEAAGRPARASSHVDHACRLHKRVTEPAKVSR